VLDSRLKFIQQSADDSEALALLEASPRFAVSRDSDAAEPLLRVLVQVEEQVATETLEEAGISVTARAGDVVAGKISLAAVEELDALEGVVLIESSRPMVPELDVSVGEIRANVVHIGPPGLRGAGVIVGIIDSGIDWRHETFRSGSLQTRILRIWDQNLAPQAGEASPTGPGYGVEYDAARINTALASPNPLTVVRHMDGTGHGTLVAGIAAGDGSPAGNGSPASTFIGVAPEADIIFVSNSVTTEVFGDSASTLDGVQYIFNVAQALQRPCVINLSQGDNLGPHDGTSLLERGIDNLLGDGGRAMVKSAGNAANAGAHANGTVTASTTTAISVLFPANDTEPDTIDFWYAATDRISVRITPPGGVASATVAAGSLTTLSLPNGNRVFVDSVIGHPNNGDNRIYLQFQQGTSSAIQMGTWTITLVGVTVTNGTWHGWVERPTPAANSPVPQFMAPHRNDATTISVPGTSREVITAGSYITRGAGVGNLSTFSSRGPTRDGRSAPTLSAPGEMITSALAGAAGTNQWRADQGTSFAAPHLPGVIALMLQAERHLRQAQIIHCLVNNARVDAFTGATPNNNWGAGKVDAARAVACADTFPKLFTPFKDPTLFTPRTLFTQFKRFTPPPRFTPFNRFTPSTRFTIDPDPAPFVRFRNTIFDPADLALDRFEDFAPYAAALAQLGITRLDQLAMVEIPELEGIEMGGDEAAALVSEGQNLLREMSSGT
jgi:hypothetical protein